MEKLRRAKTDKKIRGVCKGLANSLQIDVAYIRLLWIALACVPPFSSVLVILLYIILATVLPEESEVL